MTVAHVLSCWIPYRPLRKKTRSFFNKIFSHIYIKEDNPLAKKAFLQDFCIFKHAPQSFEMPHYENPQVSIIIPVYNQYQYTALCLWSILQNTENVPYEVIIADDCSTDNTINIDKAIKNLKIVRTPTNLRFLKNCNHAARHASGKYLLFLNNDTQVQKNWLKPLVDVLEQDDRTGLVGSQLLYPNQKLQEAGGIIYQDASGNNYGRNHLPWLDEYNYLKEVDYISGCSIILKKSLWQELGGFDETFAPAYYEDTDLAFRIREKGLKVIYQPLSKVIHFEGISNGTALTTGQKQYQVINAQKFAQKWNHVLKKSHSQPSDIFLARDRSQNKKVLLFIDHGILTYDKDTGSRASLQYLQFFVAHGFKVVFLPNSKSPYDYHLDTLRQLGIEVLSSRFYDTKWTQWLQKNGRYIDYVYLNRPDLADIYYSPIRKYTKAKIIYQGHDLHHLRLYREYEITKDKTTLKKAQKLEKIESKLPQLVDVMLFFSPVEVDFIKKKHPSAILDAVPLYIFDTKLKSEICYDAPHRKDILFIGGYRHTSNVDAALWMSREVMPLVIQKLPNIVLHLIGSHTPQSIKDLNGPNICVHGFMSDEDLDALYQTIKISVVPTRFGAGIKGKVLEALYNKIPVITTTIGAEGIPNDNNILTIRDSASEMADAIIDLYSNDSKLNQLSQMAHPFLNQHYSEACVLQKFQQWIKIQ